MRTSLVFAWRRKLAVHRLGVGLSICMAELHIPRDTDGKGTTIRVRLAMSHHGRGFCLRTKSILEHNRQYARYVHGWLHFAQTSAVWRVQPCCKHCLLKTGHRHC